MDLFTAAQESEQQGDYELAEKQYREGLAVLEHLLSPIHEETNNVAYSLASFYARRGRMKDADAVLDWMNEKHTKELGVANELTVRHALRVVDLLNSWLRPQDALTFVSRTRNCLLQSTRAEGSQADTSSSDIGNTATGAHQSTVVSSMMFQPAHQPSTQNTELGANPSLQVTHQLRSVDAHIRACDESIEPLLLSIIAQCEQDPQNMAVQNLLARAKLVKLYQQLGKLETAIEELSKTQTHLLTVWSSYVSINKELINASIELGILHLILEQYDDADELFNMIQGHVVDEFGPDDRRTICLLIHIGLLYQNENRWDDAEPRFEQALAASMTANGLDDAVTRSLEAALENRLYTYMKSEPGDFRTIFGIEGVLIRPSMSLAM